MKDLVVAYAGADERPAALVIGKLEKLGYKVTRQTASRRTARRARQAASAPVVVLWSQNYASAGARPKAALATLRLDAAAPPPSLKAPAIDLRQWRGRDDHRGWRKLVTALGPKAVAVKKAVAPVAAVSAAQPEPETVETETSPIVGILFGIALLAAAGSGLWYLVLR